MVLAEFRSTAKSPSSTVLAALNADADDDSDSEADEEEDLDELAEKKESDCDPDIRDMAERMIPGSSRSSNPGCRDADMALKDGENAFEEKDVCPGRRKPAGLLGMLPLLQISY